VSSDFFSTDEGLFVLGAFLSDEDDISDVSIYRQIKSPAAQTNYTLLDVSDGPKVLTNLVAVGYNFRDAHSNTGSTIGPVTIDGTQTVSWPSAVPYYGDANTGDVLPIVVSPPVRYDSSLKVEWQQTGTGNDVMALAFILGSGPHSVAVVKDGEPVYMTAENLSERTIEGMNVPKGYKIVKNPEIDHPNPQTVGMWDDDRGEVVDHPFEKPFHETLDKLNRMSRRTSVQDVLDRIDKNPTPYENVFEGELPREDPVEEAIQFWYEREKENSQTLDLGSIRGKNRRG